MWIWVLPDPTHPLNLRFRNVPPAVLRGHEFMTRLWHWTKIIPMVVQTCGYFGRCILNAQLTYGTALANWPHCCPKTPALTSRHDLSMDGD